jgi:hypothetical protein
MRKKHVFVINGSRRSEYPLSPETLLAIYAILKLSKENVTTSINVLAIKTLRAFTGMGLYEAKQVVDYVSENGHIDGHGDVYISVPQPPLVSYELKED